MVTEKEAETCREETEKGQQAKIALEFLKEYLTKERALVFHELETLTDIGESASLIFFLKVLREFENNLERYIDTGEVAEKRLNESDE